MNLHYDDYLDQMLLAVAESQNGNQLRSVNLKAIHDSKFPDAPPTWLMSAATALHKAGYGVDWQSTDNLWFLIDGGGLKRAAEIRRVISSRTFSGRVKAIPRSDWISIFALFVAIIALFQTRN